MTETPDAFSGDERHGLLALLDTLIPPSRDGRLPGAGEAGVLDHLVEHAPDLRPFLLQALAALEALASERSGDRFAALAPTQRAEVVAALETNEPALLPALLFHVYTAYYQQQPVVEGLGLPFRPPFPEGYEMEATDASLLDGVRQRPPLWREA